MKDKKGRTILKIFVIAICLLLISSFGIFLDLTYRGLIQCPLFVCTLNSIKKFLKLFGVNHKALWDCISGNMGLLITMVSVSFTFMIEILERSERTTFGIPRSKITDSKKEKVMKYLYWSAAELPVLMLIYIIMGFCAASYLLLFFSYLILLIIYTMHRGSYDKIKIQNAIFVKFSEQFRGKCSVESVQSWESYEDLLTDIYKYNRTEKEWIAVQKLFFSYLAYMREKAEEFADSVSFAVVRRFVWIAFGQRDLNYEFDFFQVILRYFETIKYNQDETDYDDEKDMVFVWGMLTASFSFAREKELTDFLNAFTDFEGRSIKRIKNGWGDYSETICRKECVMLLVLLEGWLEKYPITERTLGEFVKKIYMKAEAAFQSGEESELHAAIIMFEYDSEEKKQINSAMQRLQREMKEPLKISNAAAVIESLN